MTLLLHAVVGFLLSRRDEGSGRCLADVPDDAEDLRQAALREGHLPDLDRVEVEDVELADESVLEDEKVSNLRVEMLASSA